MDQTRSDLLSRTPAARLSRRGALRTALGGVTVVGLGTFDDGEAKKKKRRKRPKEEPAGCNETACFVRAWGGLGDGEGEFDRPWGIAVSPLTGDVYVADYNNSRVQRFSASGDFLDAWGSEEPGDQQLLRVIDVAIAPNGDVLALEQGLSRIKRFTADGAYLDQWSPPEPSISHQAIAVGPSGDVYVVASSPSDQIHQFTAAGDVVRTFGGTGGGDGQLSIPDGIAIAANGDVLVADTNNHRVQRFSAAGEYLAQWHTHGPQGVEFEFPNGLAVAEDGTIYVSDASYQSVRRFTDAGAFLGEWRSEIAFEGVPMWPSDVAVQGDRIYVTDQYNNLVQQFTLAVPPKRRKKRKRKKKH